MKHIIKHYEERYFIGVEVEGGVDFDSLASIQTLWDTFLTEDMKLIADAPITTKCIGLECYPPDFMETRSFDYFALVQTERLIHRDGFVSKKLPAGNYISFPIEFDHIRDGIQRVYNYLRDQDIAVHMAFDFEDYLEEQDYTKPGAILHFSFLLEEK